MLSSAQYTAQLVMVTEAAKTAEAKVKMLESIAAEADMDAVLAESVAEAATCAADSAAAQVAQAVAVAEEWKSKADAAFAELPSAAQCYHPRFSSGPFPPLDYWTQEFQKGAAEWFAECDRKKAAAESFVRLAWQKRDETAATAADALKGAALLEKRQAAEIALYRAKMAKNAWVEADGEVRQARGVLAAANGDVVRIAAALSKAQEEESKARIQIRVPAVVKVLPQPPPRPSLAPPLVTEVRASAASSTAIPGYLQGGVGKQMYRSREGRERLAAQLAAVAAPVPPRRVAVSEPTKQALLIEQGGRCRSQPNRPC